jgi:hypothetical protein
MQLCIRRERLTPFGRALEELGAEVVPGYSPPARRRSERWSGAGPGRVAAELRPAGIDALADARLTNPVQAL